MRKEKVCVGNWNVLLSIRSSVALHMQLKCVTALTKEEKNRSGHGIGTESPASCGQEIPAPDFTAGWVRDKIISNI